MNAPRDQRLVCKIVCTKIAIPRRFLLLGALTLLNACASTRFYPVCNYSGESGIQSATRQSVLNFVRATAAADTFVVFSPNDRFVVVKATWDQHSKLSLVWPRVGCLGDARYDVEYLKYRGCVYMLQQALENGGIPPLGELSDSLDQSTFYCGRPLSAAQSGKLEVTKGVSVDLFEPTIFAPPPKTQ